MSTVTECTCGHKISQHTYSSECIGDAQFIKPVQGRYLRLGVVKATDETEKMEIAGMRCGVTREENGTARIYVFDDSKGAVGPYMIASDEVLKG